MPPFQTTYRLPVSSTDLKTRFRAAQTAKQRGRAAPRGVASQGRGIRQAGE